jgi:hypothetical protein
MAHRLRPQKSPIRTGRATFRPQHDHLVDVRGRPLFPLRDECRLRPSRPRFGYPAGAWRVHPHMLKRLDGEELADWRSGRDAVYQLGSLRVGARLAIADA